MMHRMFSLLHATSGSHLSGMPDVRVLALWHGCLTTIQQVTNELCITHDAKSASPACGGTLLIGS